MSKIIHNIDLIEIKKLQSIVFMSINSGSNG